MGYVLQEQGRLLENMLRNLSLHESELTGDGR